MASKAGSVPGLVSQPYRLVQRDSPRGHPDCQRLLPHRTWGSPRRAPVCPAYQIGPAQADYALERTSHLGGGNQRETCSDDGDHYARQGLDQRL